MKKLPKPIKFEWDKGNQDKNWHKHKTDAKEIEQVFFNKPIQIFKDVKHSQEEDRFVALGITNQNRKLYIVFTIRKSKLRIISARDQSKKERIFYEKKPE